VLIARRNFTFDGKVRAVQEAEFVVYEGEEKASLYTSELPAALV
jgi:hypothetical protein